MQIAIFIFMLLVFVFIILWGQGKIRLKRAKEIPTDLLDAEMLLEETDPKITGRYGSISFDPKIKDLTVEARQECLNLGDRKISSLHLLLALFALKDSEIQKNWKRKEINIEDIRNQHRKGQPISFQGDLPISREAEYVLKLTYSEAGSRGEKIVKPSHLLLAMLSYEQSLACSVLHNLGFQYHSLAQELKAEASSKS